MAEPTEVALTSRSSARWQKGVVAVSLVGTVAGAVVAIATDPQWWVILIWVAASLILILIMLGLWAAANQSASATEELRKSGVVTRADVINGERVTQDDEIRYVLTLEIRPVGHDAFTVTHSCSNYKCAEVVNNVPTTITVLADAATRSWAVLHAAE